MLYMYALSGVHLFELEPLLATNTTVEVGQFDRLLEGGKICISRPEDWLQ